MLKRVHIDIRKLRDYCLNPNHPVGKHKAKVFATTLGLDRSDADSLKVAIMDSLPKVVFTFIREDIYGKRYIADLNIQINQRNAVIRTIWIQKNGLQVSELVTCYVIT